VDRVCTPCPEKKVPLIFFAVTFTNIDGFSWFFMHNFARECQSHWRKKITTHSLCCYHTCKSLRHKSNTFHTNISTLHMFISITFTETSIDETNKTQQKVRGLKCISKCPPFTQTHAFKRLRHCTIADGFGDSVQSWCYAASLLGTRG